MRELLPYVSDLVGQHNEQLVGALNGLAEAGQILNVLGEASGVITKPMTVTVSEGKYRGENLPVHKLQITESGIAIWVTSAVTGKPVKVQGTIVLQKEETANE